MSTAVAAQPKGQDQPRSTAEWVSLVIALLILVGIVGIVIYLWTTTANAPAQFTLTPGEVRQSGELYYLPVTVVNDGDETAAQVMLMGSIASETDREEATTTIDFLPGHAEAEVVFVFSADPSDAELRVVSYQKP